MNASVKLGRPFGIPVGVHWSALLVGVLAVWSLSSLLSEQAPGYADGTYLATAVVTVVLYFAALVGHELGHAIVARRNHLRVERITLWAFGGFAQLADPSPRAGVELRVAAAGPAVSLAAAAVFFAAARAADLATDARALVAALSWLAWINLLLAVFNLLPARPLDGGRILTALLWLRTRDRSRATLRASQVSRVVGWGLSGFGVWLLMSGWFLGLWLLLVAWMIVGSSGVEQRVERWRAALSGLTLRDVMAPPPPVLPGWTELSDAAADPRVRQHPVVVVERFDGLPAVVSTAAMVRLASSRPTVTLADVAQAAPTGGVRLPDQPATSLLDSPVGFPVLVREADGRLVGQVSPAELERWTQWREGKRASWSAPSVPVRV